MRGSPRSSSGGQPSRRHGWARTASQPARIVRREGAMTAPESRLTVLCVDDEPNVLEGLRLVLRRRFEVHTATSGQAGLTHLSANPSTAIVMSDMRMPGMDGAAFLSRARAEAPRTVRLLLTGQADLAAAIAAVNDGALFRFLTKPCPPASLLSAMSDAAAQYRLQSVERDLLEQTLHGSIKTLADVLAITNPAAFGRSLRLKRLAVAIADRLDLRDRWQLELAAMLSQLGFVSVPDDVAQRLCRGDALSDAEQQMVDRAPVVTDQLLASIPRLEGVREILMLASGASVPTAPDDRSASLRLAAQILRAAGDFEALTVRGAGTDIAVQRMLRQRGDYRADVVEAMVAIAAAESHVLTLVCDVPLRDVEVGMVLAADVRLTSGMLLAAAGYEVTSTFVERARNAPPGSVVEPIRVRTCALDRSTARRH
ncbi:MAG: response regulator [Vicinamibacterales bacterium]